MNRWKLTEEVRNKYTPIVTKFIEELESIPETSTELLEKDFSDTELNPSTLLELLEYLGYENQRQEDNGWELDFWIYVSKPNFKPICIQGCGMTFELRLSGAEEDEL